MAKEKEGFVKGAVSFGGAEQQVAEKNNGQPHDQNHRQKIKKLSVYGPLVRVGQEFQNKISRNKRQSCHFTEERQSSAQS